MSKFDKNIFKLGEIHHEDLTCYRSIQARFKLGLVLTFKLGSIHHRDADFILKVQAHLARLIKLGVKLGVSINESQCALTA